VLDARVAALHTASVACLVLSTAAVFTLYQHGSASATTTAVAISPIPAMAAAALLLDERAGPFRVAAAGLVVAAVIAALPGSFTTLARRAAVVAVAAAASGHGVLTVLSAELLEAGAGTFEIYLVRTLVCGALFTALVPPRDIPWDRARALGSRSVLVSGHFIAILVAVRHGSAVVVQTTVATAPLLAIALEQASGHARASPRTVLCGVLALLGVAAVAAG
jgi:drug/metabolite transporter (DMT)-like permease